LAATGYIRKNMATQYTSLLGLALPVTGELSGTWGATVNTAITSLLDEAVAGTTSITVDADITLTTTAGIANQSRQAVILWNPASGTTTRNITAPAQSKIYTVINASGGTQSIVFRGAGPTTGVTIVKGESAVVAWNGTDFIKVSNTSGAGTFTNVTVTGNLTVNSLTSTRVPYASTSGLLVDSANMTFNGTRLTVADLADSGLTSGRVTYASTGGALVDSANLTFDGTNLTLGGGTANGVAYLNGSKVLTTGSALVFDGTNLGIGTSSPGFQLDVRRSTNSNVANFQQTGASLNTDIYVNNAGSANNFLISRRSNGESWFFNSGADPFVFSTNSAERMRLSTAGFLGVGTTAPVSLISISGSGYTALSEGDYVGLGAYFATGAWRNTQTNMGGSVIRHSSGAMGFHTDTVTGAPGSTFTNGMPERMRLNSSGNLGLGVTPSAWGSNGNLQMTKLSFAPNDYSLGSNYYQGDTYRYATNDTAARLSFFNGGFTFYTAPSGTAGNAISFTQAMTLTAAGNLGLGTTSPSAFSGYSTMTLDGSTGSFTEYRQAGGNTMRIGADSNLGFIFTQQAIPLRFGTADTERARIDSGGNLLVGTTSRIAGTNAPIQGYANGGSCILGQQVSSTADNISLWNSATSGNNVFVQFYTETSITARGSISYNRGAGLVAYNTTSDYRTKDIIGPVVDSGILIDSTPVYMGKMKGATQERPMFIAHETPDYAHTGEKDAVDADGNPVFQQMDASALIPVMWAEIQSLRARVAALESN
jgi:hypothetical protein